MRGMEDGRNHSDGKGLDSETYNWWEGETGSVCVTKG